MACSDLNITEPDDGNEVRRQFILFQFQRPPMEQLWCISVNKDNKISYASGPWHGSAIYTPDVTGGRWTLTYHYFAEEERMHTNTYHEIPGTGCFVNWSGNSPDTNAILMTYTAPTSTTSTESRSDSLV